LNFTKIQAQGIKEVNDYWNKTIQDGRLSPSTDKNNVLGSG